MNDEAFARTIGRAQQEGDRCARAITRWQEEQDRLGAQAREGIEAAHALTDAIQESDRATRRIIAHLYPGTSE